MVTSPHHLASQSGLAELRVGGSAVEAVIAAAATLTTVYPHMTSLGGDGFWLIGEPGCKPLAIAAAGPSGAGVDAAFYRRHGLATIPARGPLAAITVAGAVDGGARPSQSAKGGVADRISVGFSPTRSAMLRTARSSARARMC